MMIRRRLTFSLVAALLFPLSLVAAGHDLSAVRKAPAYSQFGRGTAAVAFEGNRFLTIWTRSGNIYGAQTDPDGGTTGDAFPILLSASPNLMQLVPTGDGYLAIWSEGSFPYLATLTSEGALDRRVRLDSSGFIAPQMAFNGKRILVIDRTGPYVSPAATIVSIYELSGALVHRFSLPVSGIGSYAVTAAGDDFAIATSRASFYIDEWRVANDGTILSTTSLPPAPRLAATTEVSVASNNDRVAVAWVDLQTATVSSAVIASDGTITHNVVSTGGLAVNLGVAVLPVESGFVVAWNVFPRGANPEVLAVRIGMSGALLDSLPAHLGDGNFVAAASSGNAVTFALSAPALGAAELTATVNDAGISPLPVSSASVMAVEQMAPAVASNGAGFTAAWSERSTGPHGVEAGRVSRDGEVLDGAGIGLDSASASFVTIARGSSETLTVWSNDAGVFAARVTPFGVVLDPTPIPIAPQRTSHISVAWNGSRYFVVWPEASRLAGAFVGVDGVVTTPKELTKVPATDVFFTPDVAWDGHQFIVVFAAGWSGFNCNPGCGPPANNVRVMRVSASGDAIDAVPLRVAGTHSNAHVASSGEGALVALEDYAGISTVAVRDDGGVLSLAPEVPLFRWFYSSVSSDVTWDGSAYIVGWSYPAISSARAWLGAARMSESGSPFDRRFAAMDSAGGGVSIAANDLGESALAVAELVPPAYLSRARLYLTREMSPVPAPPAAPRNAVIYFSGDMARVEWQSGGPADGFFLERSFDSGENWSPLSVRSADVHTDSSVGSRNDRFRVSAFGPGGLSGSVIATPAGAERRRAARP